MKKGYSFEHEIENFFLALAGQCRSTSLLDRSFRVPSSGSFSWLKGDVYTNIPFLPRQFVIECKSRKGASFYLKTQWLQKLESEAAQLGRIPLFAISLKGRKKDRVWFLIRVSDFIKLFSTKPDIQFSLSPTRRGSYVLRDIREYTCCGAWLLLRPETLKTQILRLKTDK